MIFNDRIKQLRENRQIPQRKLAAALDSEKSCIFADKSQDIQIVSYDVQ
jgi:DNA-binding XRE family transcriptional regulator